MSANDDYSQIAPPRRGAVIALAVDTTCRAYDMKALALGGFTPNEAKRQQVYTVLWMQAETNDVYFYFADGLVNANADGSSGAAVITTDVDDIVDTNKITAGNALAFDVSYAAIIKAGNVPIRLRIDRAHDRFLVVKAATAGILRFWAGSAGF